MRMTFGLGNYSKSRRCGDLWSSGSFATMLILAAEDSLCRQLSCNGIAAVAACVMRKVAPDFQAAGGRCKDSSLGPTFLILVKIARIAVFLSLWL